MDIFKAAEKLMMMDDAAWARHANPWSGYSRLVAAIPIFFALWSAHWIGWWAIVPILVVVAWVYLNPRLFPAPSNVDSWISQGVLGERVYINRKSFAVPDHHIRMATTTTAVAVLFLAVGIYGFFAGDFWAAFCGWFGSVLAKCWFIDRMVWLWADMKDSHPVYAAWNKADWTAKFD